MLDERIQERGLRRAHIGPVQRPAQVPVGRVHMRMPGEHSGGDRHYGAVRHDAAYPSRHEPGQQGRPMGHGARCAAGHRAAGACSSSPQPQTTASAYFAAWAKQDWAAMQQLVSQPPADFTAVNQAAFTDLGVHQASFTAGTIATSGSTATEPFTEQLAVPGLRTITIKPTLHLTQVQGHWLVSWSPATIAPSLQSGDQLALHVTWPTRAAILGQGGAPLVIGQVYEERLGRPRQGHRRLPAHLRRAREDQRRRPSPPSSASTGRRARGPTSRSSSSASSRTPAATRRRPTSAPRWRTSTPTGSTTSPPRSRRGSASSSCAARTRRRSRALANLYERVEQWAELCDVLERHYDIAPDDHERVEVLLRRAKLFNERLGRDDSALDDYNRVLDIDYANVEALYAIADIWRRRNDPQEIVTALHQTVDRAAAALPAENLVALYRELGTTLPDRRSTSRTTPSTPGASCSRSTRATSRPWPRSRACSAPRSAGPRSSTSRCSAPRPTRTPHEKVREYLEVAALWENQVGEKDRATPAYEKILAIDPTHDQAFLALEELHDAAHRSEPLIELYLARLDTREDVHDKTTILRKVAKVFEEQLDDKPQAFDALLTAFEMDYADMDVVRYLERMTQATNRWPELVAHGQRLAPAADRAAARRSRSACASPSGTPRTSGTPSTRSRTTSRSSSSTRTTSPCSARWPTSSRSRASGSSRARRSSRRSTSPSPTSTARRSSPRWARSSRGG